jgi:3-hydroxyacyl-[acyl-carrier-protein] dehydratase
MGGVEGRRIMPPRAIINPEEFPTEVLVDAEGLRKANPQRFEMEQLTGITLIDSIRKIIIGFKDVREDEFWVKGHMPGYPLLPGVLMCEAAAQLSAYYCRHNNILRGDFMAFGGMDEVRFRGIVRPGDRLWVVGRTEKYDLRKMVFDIQEFVDGQMVFNGVFIGVPLYRQE